MTKPTRFGLPSILLTLTLTLIVLGSAVQHLFGHFNNPDVDFYVYYFAAQTVHDNPRADLYYGAHDGNPEAMNAPPGSELYKRAEAAGVREVMLYLYPPLLADLLVPLSSVPPHLAATLWRAINLALVFLSVLAIARMLRIRILSLEFFLLALTAYAFFPITEALAVGQITIVMLALWTVAVVSYSEGWIVLSACALAVATALKITPVLVVPLFFLWKDRRWLVSYATAIACIGGALLAINGWHMLDTDLKVMSAMGGSVAALQNKCISAVVGWLYYGRFTGVENGVPTTPPHPLALLERFASLGFYFTCLILVWPRRLLASLASRVLVFALFALITATTSPVSWRHAYAIALVPLALLWAQALRTAVSTFHATILALATLAMGSTLFDRVALLPLPNPVQILSASVLTVSTVLLCLEVLRRGPLPEDAIPAGDPAHPGNLSPDTLPAAL